MTRSLEVLHSGPYLTKDDIVPFITKNAKTCIFSAVRGTQGVLKVNSSGVIMSKNGTRMPAVAFDRGEPVMIVKENEKIFIITKDTYEKLRANQ